jgi:hypothetical protein
MIKKGTRIVIDNYLGINTFGEVVEDCGDDDFLCSVILKNSKHVSTIPIRYVKIITDVPYEYCRHSIAGEPCIARDGAKAIVNGLCVGCKKSPVELLKEFGKKNKVSFLVRKAMEHVIPIVLADMYMVQVSMVVKKNKKVEL